MAPAAGPPSRRAAAGRLRRSGLAGGAGPFGAGDAAAGIAGARPQPVVFVALHGPYGEDGTVQAILEAAGLAYTGSGVAASAIGMDKPFFKRFARDAGLPVLPWLDLTAGHWAADRAGTLAALDAFAADAPGRRVIVKPACLGSSVGMSIAWTPADRGPALELALRYDARVLVEPCLPTPRELEVAVLGNPPGDPRIGGPGEVIPSRDFYDYVDKYVVDAARILTRAEVDEATAARCRSVAAVAYALIGAQGFARVDFLLDRRRAALPQRDQHDPGLHPDQPLPRMMAEAGISFGELCARIVELGAAARATRPADAWPPRIFRDERRPPGPRRTRPAAGRPAARLGRVHAAPRPRRPGHARHGRPHLGAVASPVFEVRTVEVEGAALTGDEAVRAALDLPRPAPNAFTLATDALRERLLALPAVADAEVSVGLPGTLRVRIEEREPVLAWRHADALLLVDRDGLIVADAAADGPAAGAAAEGLPIVTDRRTSGSPAGVGGRLDAIDLDVATRLLPLLPADVGSTAPALLVGVDDADGWTLVPTVGGPVDRRLRLLRPGDPASGDDPGAGPPPAQPPRRAARRGILRAILAGEPRAEPSPTKPEP